MKIQRLPNPEKPRQFFLSPFLETDSLEFCFGEINAEEKRRLFWVLVSDDLFTHYVAVFLKWRIWRNYFLIVRWWIPKWLYHFTKTKKNYPEAITIVWDFIKNQGEPNA